LGEANKAFDFEAIVRLTGHLEETDRPSDSAGIAFSLAGAPDKNIAINKADAAAACPLKRRAVRIFVTVPGIFF
jgi:hypothetical protein